VPPLPLETLQGWQPGPDTAVRVRKNLLCPICSVASLDPGSGAFLTLDPGSGIGFFRIPDLGSRIPNPYVC
jgi:hypothetical protein